MEETPSSPSELEDGGNGKKRKYCGSASQSTSCAKEEGLSSLFSAYASSSGAFPGRGLKILSQPELQHRARYQTEGSRGSVKDREGSGFPTIQLKGYSGPERKVRLQVFIGSDSGRPVYPHVYYQACRVAGKNSTPSSEIRQEGTDVILMDMEAEKDFIVRCDCVGILKERYSDIENKIPSQKQRTNWKKKSTKCRLVFRVELEDDGAKETLQVVSDPISCSQQPGTPEILKMSTEVSPLNGGGELWMIGKNFLKDAVVVFQENVPEGHIRTPPWTQIIPPDKDFFNNSHMIVSIPPFTGLPSSSPIPTTSVDVIVFVKCGEKTSDSHAFTYRTPINKEGSSGSNAKDVSTSSTSSSPKCVSPARSSSRNPSRITILEPVETRYLTKEEIDYCEDTVFDPEKTQDEGGGSSYLYRQSIPEESNSSITFSSNTNTTALNNNPAGPGGEEESSGPQGSSSSDVHPRVTTFSNLFGKKVDPPPPVVDGGVMVIPKISSDTLKAAQKELLKNDVESKILVNGGNTNGNIANHPSTEFLGTNIEPKSATNGPIYIQGTESDNATISIKLPNSIISNSEKFENVMNTINKALLQPDPSLKSIDSNLARVDISTPSDQQSSPPSNNNGESSELHPKKQKITEAPPDSSDWLETWNSPGPPASSGAPPEKAKAPGPTPMDTSSFFTPQEPPETPTWSADANSAANGGGTPSDPKGNAAAAHLSTIIPERTNTVAAENWNSVKVEAENWSKTAPTSWGTPESWHSQASGVSQNWTTPAGGSAPSKDWSEAGTFASGTEELVIAAGAGPVASSAAEVVWKPAETPSNPEPPPASANNPWPEKPEDTVVVSNWSSEGSKKEGPEAGGGAATNWFSSEPGKINTLWNEEWSSNGKGGETPVEPTGGSWEKPGVVEPPSSAWTTPDNPPEAPQSGPTQNWVPESEWTTNSEPASVVVNQPDAEKKELVGGEDFISQEMTPIDPKKVMYDPSPMEVDGVFTKAKLVDYKAAASNGGGSIKGNPLLSESSAIISQQQKIESAIIEPGKVSGFHHHHHHHHVHHNPLKYQPSNPNNEGTLFQLFTPSSTDVVPK